MKISDLVIKSLTPLIYINGALMLGSGALLFTENTWMSMLLPVFMIMTGSLVFPIVLMPAGIFLNLMQLTAAQRPLLSRGFMLTAMGYFIGIMSLYAFLVFHLSSGWLATPEWLPGMVWIVSASVMAFAVFATGDRTNVFFITLVIFLELGVTVAMLLRGEYGVFWVTASVMALLFLLQNIAERMIAKK